MADNRESEGLINGTKASSTRVRDVVIALLTMAVIGLTVVVVTFSFDHSKASKFDFLKGYCDHIPPISEQEFAMRRNGLAFQLQNDSLSAIIIEPGANMQYLTGFSWGLSERPFLMVMLQNGSVAFVCPKFEEDRAVEMVGSNAKIFVWSEHENPYVIAGEALNIDGATTDFQLGLDHEIRYFIANGLQEAWPNIDIEFGKDVIDNIRMIKSPAEIDILRCVNEATKAAQKAIYPHFQEGLSESDVSVLIREALAATGVGGGGLVLFGSNAAYPHGTSNRLTMKKGELVLIDVGGKLHGYTSDITRTTLFGEISDLPEIQRKAWNTVKLAQLEAFKHLKPGVPCEDSDAAARVIIEREGFNGSYDLFTHRLGHGIGLQGHEEPYLVQGNMRLLQPGMTFSNEPGIYVKGDYGVRLEDIFVITETGYEVFGPLAESLENPFGE